MDGWALSHAPGPAIPRPFYFDTSETSDVHYIITNHDNPDKMALRMEVREAHIAYLKSDHKGVKLVMAGPLLNGHGEMIGSHLVVMADDVAAVEQFQKGDPMAQSGLFLSSRIDAWKWVIGNPDAPAHGNG